MVDLWKGLLAALIATIVLSLLILGQEWLGLMPQFNLIKDLSIFAGTPNYMVSGWILHFIIGTVFWGVLYVILEPIIPSQHYWVKGVEFGIFTWLLMMVIFMPNTGGGFFAINYGYSITLMTFILHLIDGIVLASLYGAFVSHPQPMPTNV